MTEALFPILGSALVFGAVLPLSALVVKGVLVALRRVAKDPLHDLQGTRHVLLVGSSAVPLAWLVSASAHQVETGECALVCISVHARNVLCPEALLFPFALVAAASLLAAPRLVSEWWRGRAASSARGRDAAKRVATLVAQNAALAALAGRVVVCDRLHASAATVGLLRPRVLLRTSFVEAIDDDALAAALGHEREHVRGRDPLRYFLAWWALAANPFGGWLLEPELGRWILARETHCDREAVVSGASAPALADALVTAARGVDALARPIGAASSAGLVPLIGSGLRFRVELLLAYAERPPARCCRSAPSGLLLALVMAAAIALPHGGGTAPLDVLHEVAESTGSLLTPE